MAGRGVSPKQRRGPPRLARKELAGPAREGERERESPRTGSTPARRTRAGRCGPSRPRSGCGRASAAPWAPRRCSCSFRRPTRPRGVGAFLVVVLKRRWPGGVGPRLAAPASPPPLRRPCAARASSFREGAGGRGPGLAGPGRRRVLRVRARPDPRLPGLPRPTRPPEPTEVRWPHALDPTSTFGGPV